MALIDLNKYEDHILLTRDDLADWLATTARTVTRMVTEESPGLPFVTIGGRQRFRVGEVKRWIDAKAVQKNPRADKVAVRPTLRTRRADAAA
ncbi:helix-turn-helix domain-containing protein [Shinella sp. DD12]|uniref:helix-turn-helix domain-containing protein n=1 Tax=Shinella sp. DD12 TaxID=1410620 RepID=UPI0003C53600|nr:helix-turn-helix domain-containing protein [Shinella sp. DD12]EYR80006.1 hypothetical protein SHLA_1c001860 [Shinella sp. DD12]